jgi:two-component system, NtrC family, sensor kinase
MAAGTISTQRGIWLECAMCADRDASAGPGAAQLFRFVLERFPEPVYCVNAGGRIVYANEAACRLTGRTREQMLALAFADLDAHCAQLGWTALAARIREREPVILRTEHLTPEGVRVPVETTAHSLAWSGLESCVIFARDLSAQHAAESAARESEARLRSIFEGVETGIFLIDPKQHRIVDANPVALHLVGAPLEKVAGAVCHRFVCPADKGRCPVTDLGQTVDNSERVLLTVGGEKRAIIKTVRPVEMGGEAYLLESFLDITDRKRAEQRLAEQTAYLNTLIDTSPLGIAVFDREGRIQTSNAALERLFGFTREEMQGASLHELFLQEDRAAEAQRLQQECRRDCSVHFTTQRRRKDGGLVDVEVYGVPLTIPGKPAGILALYQDITERTRIEAERVEQHRLATLAAEVGLALSTAETLSGGLQPCAEALVRSTDIVFAGIWTTGEKLPYLERQATADMQMGLGGEGMDLERVAHIARSGVPELDRALCDHPQPEPGAGRERPAFAGYPLKVGEQVVGVAAVLAREPLTEAALQALESVAHTLAQFVERKRAEASLRESEDRFRTAFEEAPYGMCLTGLDGRFLHANTALCRMLGYSSEELLSGAWQQVTHPDDLERSHAAAMEFSHGRVEPLAFEKRYIHKRGHPIWARVKVSVVKDAAGQPEHFITQIEDVTLRKRADEAQAFLASLVESTQVAIVGTTPQGVILSWNRGAAELYGYSPAEMIGGTGGMLAPAERREEQERLLARVRAGERVANYETVRVRKDGRRVDVSLALSPVYDEAGTITGMATIARDITRRREAERALKSSEERYRELFENASDLVYTFDLDLHITSLNRLAETTMGYAREEAVGMPLRALAGEETWRRAQHRIGRLLAGDPPQKFEADMRTRDGQRLNLEVNPRLIFRNDVPVGIQAIARDITGRDVAEMELRQAQKLESVGRLASGIAHEINTPMQFVGDNVRFLEDSFAELGRYFAKQRAILEPTGGAKPGAVCRADLRQLEEELDLPYLLREIPEALHQTVEGIERVVTIVRAMKEFAHPESRDAVRADLNKALENTLTVARNELKYVAEVETDFGPLPPVVCSVSDMNQVFLNLLVNAAHAIGEVVAGTERKGKIRIHTEVQGPMVLITIADSGGGIPARIREHIFDPFFTTKEVGRGTGQGLAIARAVVDRHKGSLTFESEEGKGTTFFIRLPVDGAESQGAA